MPGINSGSFFRFLYLSLVVLVTAFLWPGGTARGEVRVIRDTIRVGIAQQLPQVNVSFQGHYCLVDTSSGEVIAETGNNELWTMNNAGGLIMLSRDDRQYGIIKGAIRAEEVNVTKSILSGAGTMVQKDSLSGMAVMSGTGGVRYISNTGELRVVDGEGAVSELSRGGLNLFGLERFGRISRYRGNVEVRPGNLGFTVINELPVEHYLYGVVPAEMPGSFPMEALKAQAVAARSYAIAQMGSYMSQGFDILDSQQNQVYRGYDGEISSTTRAVDETAGEVLVYRGQPIAAFFHSSSGGFTENCEDVWFDRLGYLRAREDPRDRNDKYYNWLVSYTAEQLTMKINEQIKKIYDNGNGSPVEFSIVTDLIELERTSTGQRVKRLLVKGLDIAGNPAQMEVGNADRVRSVLGLNSSLFTMQKQTDAGGRLMSIVFNGCGFGHGLGMSQWGASGLALEGYSYQDILQYYYTGVELVDNYGV